MTSRHAEATARFRLTLFDAASLNRPARVLLVQPDTLARKVLAAELRRDGYEVLEAGDSFELASVIGTPLTQCHPVRLPDLIIAEVDLPSGPGGLELLSLIRRAEERTPVILISEPDPDGPDEELMAAAQRLGAAYVFTRPCSLEDVRVAALSLATP